MEIFDKAQLLDELDGDREFLVETLSMLDEDGPKLLAEAAAAVAAQDPQGVARAAHTLKSMVGNFCAPPAFDAAVHLERVGKEGDLQACQAGWDALDAELGRLRQALHSLVDEWE